MRYRAVPIGTLAAALLSVATAFGQPPQPPTGGGRGQEMPPRSGGQQVEAPRGTAIIRGVVLAADTGTPVRRAQVRASAPAARQSRLATTDANGRFEIRELAAGNYTVSASKSGFVSLRYGQRRTTDLDVPIPLADGQVVDKVVIGLPRGSVIAGRVTDEFGEPLANANVTAMRYGYISGARRLTPAQSRTTDDLGQFRLFGLTPGDYVVSANFRNAETTESSSEPPTGYAPTYYPGTPNPAEAQRLRVEVGQEQSSVVFALVAARLVRVSGTVMNSQGVPITNGNVMIGPTGGGLPGTNINTGRIESNGAFRINNVPPGRYRLQVRTNLRPPGPPPGRGAPATRPPEVIETARQDIVVGNEDVNGIAMVTSPGARVAGAVVLDTGSVTPPPAQVQIFARPAQFEQGPMTGGVPSAQARPDGSFELNGVFDARVFRTGGSAGWYLKQVLLNGQDITDVPMVFPAGQAFTGLQLVLTDKITNLSGRVLDARGNPVLDTSVVVFPVDERLWIYQSRHIRSARPDHEGKYQIGSLPFGEYLIVAVQGLEEGQAGDRDFLLQVRQRAVKFSLNEGETKAVDVQIAR